MLKRSVSTFMKRRRPGFGNKVQISSGYRFIGSRCDILGKHQGYCRLPWFTELRSREIW